MHNGLLGTQRGGLVAKLDCRVASLHGAEVGADSRRPGQNVIGQPIHCLGLPRQV